MNSSFNSDSAGECLVSAAMYSDIDSGSCCACCTVGGGDGGGVAVSGNISRRFGAHFLVVSTAFWSLPVVTH